eukprot:SAG31_NODE_1106_length_9878_cov_4.621331_8_plen_172_part_00
MRHHDAYRQSLNTNRLVNHRWRYLCAFFLSIFFCSHGTWSRRHASTRLRRLVAMIGFLTSPPDSYSLLYDHLRNDNFDCTIRKSVGTIIVTGLVQPVSEKTILHGALLHTSLILSVTDHESLRQMFCDTRWITMFRSSCAILVVACSPSSSSPIWKLVFSNDNCYLLSMRR